MHDAHLGCALFFLDMLAENIHCCQYSHGYAMSLVCSWNELGMSYVFFKLSAYKMGVSMRLLKLRFLSLFKLPFSISGENRSLNEHLRPKFGLK